MDNEAYNYTVKSSYILKTQTFSDWQIFSAAKASEKLIIIISKDGDFPKILAQKGAPPKVIKLNTGNLPNKVLWACIKPILPEIIRILTTTEKEIIGIEKQEPI